MNDLILEKLKKINLQDIIKKDHQNYESKWGKTSNFSEYSLPWIFLGNIYKRHFIIKRCWWWAKQFCCYFNLDLGKKANGKEFKKK